VLVAALVLGGCGGGSAKRLADRELANLVLQSSDLSRRYSVFAAGKETHGELAPALRGDEHRFGRQGGWVARYRTTSRSPAHGALTLVSTADVFAGSSAAGKYFGAVRKYDQQTAPATGLKDEPIPRVGDEARAVASPPGPPRSVRIFVVTWRDGRIVATVSATGFARSLRLADVLALVRRQESRIVRVS
jgi:hypothetical protein